MGASKFVPVVFALKSLSFGLQAVGSTASKAVKFINARNKALNVSSLHYPNCLFSQRLRLQHCSVYKLHPHDHLPSRNKRDVQGIAGS
jgi:hypothetical protein